MSRDVGGNAAQRARVRVLLRIMTQRVHVRITARGSHVCSTSNTPDNLWKESKKGDCWQSRVPCARKKKKG